MQSTNSDYGSPHVISLTRINSPRLVSGAKWFWELMAGYWKLHLCLVYIWTYSGIYLSYGISTATWLFLKKGRGVWHRGVASFSKVRGMDVVCLLTIKKMNSMTEGYKRYNIQDIKSFPFKWMILEKYKKKTHSEHTENKSKLCSNTLSMH